MVVVLSCVQDKPALPEDESREREEEETDVTADGGCDAIQLYISDWMGSKVYSGEHGKLYFVAIPLYTIGYWYGVRCLMLTWAVTGLMSLDVEPIVRALGAAKNLWAAENFILAGSLAITLYISKLVKDERLERNDLTFTHYSGNTKLAMEKRVWSLKALSPRSVPLDSYLMVMSSLSQLELGSTPVQISV
ncbi:hypothetical protein Ahy_A04g018660 [Arachis hypogaea]|uniref:Uncharacterized protein n=1 Tax=Arachis hypogaea TaxID=3818 RepID=A0A445DE79_ARAHY|nr:hypothetical protein Ahy_A04g018660 [Arachis hypogaea]